MRVSSVLSIVTLASAAAAAPEVYERASKDVCCSGVLSCVVVVGSACKSGETHYKCNTGILVSDITLALPVSVSARASACVCQLLTYYRAEPSQCPPY
jgi:hypothetical protein